MVDYVKRMIQDLICIMQIPDDLEGLHDKFQTLVEELDRLDPREFLPAVSYDFVRLRMLLRTYPAVPQPRLELLHSAIKKATGVNPIDIRRLLLDVQLKQNADEVEGTPVQLNTWHSLSRERPGIG